MVDVQVKVGSVVKVPLPTGWGVVTSDPRILQASVAGGVATVTAVAPGKAKVTVSPASDLSVGLDLTVTTI